MSTGVVGDNPGMFMQHNGLLAAKEVFDERFLMKEIGKGKVEN